jgi:hypothetical protein
MSAKKAKFDTLRSLGFASISAAYAAVGSAVENNPRIFCISNNTAGDMIFSFDPSDSAGQMFVKAGSFKLFDLTSNMIPGKDDGLQIAVGSILYVKQITAPTSGSVYLEYIYG